MVKKRTPYLFIAPTLFFVITMSIIPIILSFFLGFGEYGASGYQFSGLENFLYIVKDPYFWISIKNVFFLLIFTIPLQLAFGLVLAVILNIPIVKGKTFFRTAYYLPVVTSAVAVSFLFGQFFAPNGLLNNILATFGGPEIPWLMDPTFARISMIVVIVWQGTGYYVTLYLAGLQSIGEELYEAADIDGANAIVKFFKITVPQLKPLIFFSVITATIGGLNTFQVPNILFSGGQGPGQVALMPGTYLYDAVMTTPNYGHASVVGWILAVFSIGLAWMQFKVGDEK